MNDEPPVLGPGPAPPTAGAPPPVTGVCPPDAPPLLVTAPPTPLPPDATLDVPPLPATAAIGAAPACDALLPPAEGPPSLASCAPQATQKAPARDALRKNSVNREA